MILPVYFALVLFVLIIKLSGLHLKIKDKKCILKLIYMFCKLFVTYQPSCCIRIWYWFPQLSQPHLPPPHPSPSPSFPAVSPSLLLIEKVHSCPRFCVFISMYLISPGIKIQRFSLRIVLNIDKLDSWWTKTMLVFSSWSTPSEIYWSVGLIFIGVIRLLRLKICSDWILRMKWKLNIILWCGL